MKIIPIFAASTKIVKNMTALQLNAELYRAMGEIADNEKLLAKVLAYVKELTPAKKTKEDAGWATRFVGAWEDDRTADEIVDDILSARTTNNIDIELCPDHGYLSHNSRHTQAPVPVTTQIESNGRRSSMGAEVPDPSAPVICQ